MKEERKEGRKEKETEIDRKRDRKQEGRKFRFFCFFLLFVGGGLAGRGVVKIQGGGWWD